MELIWHGHSCFSVKSDGFTVVLDPYADDDVPGLGPLRLTANAVLCSHEHHDHNARQNVTVVPAKSPFTVTAVECFHDHARGALRGPNTIRILQAEGLRVAHFGDLGHELDEAALAAIGPIDVALIPVGGAYTIDAQQAAKLACRLGNCTVIPMHYRLGAVGYPVLQPVEEFTALLEPVTRLATNTWKVSKTAFPRVLVLRCPDF